MAVICRKPSPIVRERVFWDERSLHESLRESFGACFHRAFLFHAGSIWVDVSTWAMSHVPDYQVVQYRTPVLVR